MTRTVYIGSCHCGLIAYTVALEAEAPTFRCNCSICTKSRFWFAPVPAQDFKLTKGKNELTRYTFGPERIEHFFCSRCGIKTHGRGEDPDLGGRFVSINVATLDMTPAALAGFEILYLNGRDDQFQTAPAIASYL